MVRDKELIWLFFFFIFLNKILWFGVRELAQRSGALAALVEDLTLVPGIILATGHPTPSSGLLWTPTLTSAHMDIT